MLHGTMSLKPIKSLLPKVYDARFSYQEISRFSRSIRTFTQGLRPCQHHFLKTSGNEVRSLDQCRSMRTKNAVEKNVDKKSPAKETIVEEYKDLMYFPKATHEISELSRLPVLDKVHVVLHGYLGTHVTISKTKSVVLLQDRNLAYNVQVISISRSAAGKALPLYEKLKALKSGTPVALAGTVKTRESPAGTFTDSAKNIKNVEILVTDVQSLNSWPSDVIITPETVFSPEKRHLQLRKEEPLRNALKFRAEVAEICRHELGRRQNFTEVETPLLFKSTPEGAREFIIPTRRKGLAYALPQSPQQFKQILMASGLSRYYQIAKCFRDEDLRADRQPEFSQLDMELSFATRDDVLTLVESLINRLWRELLDISLPIPFPRITYEKAMLKYGSDKPDTRLGMPISKITPFLPADLISKLTALSSPVIEVIVLHSSKASPVETRKFIKGFLDLPSSSVFHKNPAGGPGVFIYDPTQPLQGLEAFGFEAALKISTNLSLQSGDLLILQARPDTAFTGGSTPLGNLRVALHKAAVQASHISPPIGFDPLWIVDFPLFTPISPNPPSSDIPTPAPTLHPTQTSHPTLTSTHHPFTSPLGRSDVSLLLTSPDRALGDHYDLVLNGVELGGGSRRIHHAGLQSMILSSVLKLPPARLAEFDHLIEVLRAGCPPHAGFALGFDRLVALMLGRESVRDVIAFPKSGKGEDLLVGSPGIMEEDVLKTYHLKIRE